MRDRGALHWAAKPGLEQAAGESPGLECFWVWGWRAEGGEGRGRRAELHRQAVCCFGSAVHGEDLIRAWRLPATIAEDRRALPRNPAFAAALRPDCSK